MLSERIIRLNLNATVKSKPYLGYIIVGDLAQSELYVKLKLKACDEVGIGHCGFKLPATITESDLLQTVK